MRVHKQVLHEYLGDIDPELFLQNLTNINPDCNSIDEIRLDLNELRKKGGVCTVDAEFEYEWHGDPKTTLPVAKKFVRLTVDIDHARRQPSEA
jgi:hypothetical protein